VQVVQVHHLLFLVLVLHTPVVEVAVVVQLAAQAVVQLVVQVDRVLLLVSPQQLIQDRAAEVQVVQVVVVDQLVARAAQA
jgi:hypothetical protein